MMLTTGGGPGHGVTDSKMSRTINVVDTHADQVSQKYAGIGLRKNF